MIKSFLFFIFIITNLEASSLEFMSYNVENLFDAKHDVTEGKSKEDWAYLPKNAIGKKEACLKESSKKRRKECLKSDWTQKKVDLKINQIAEVIKAKNKFLPDFLGLIEVENEIVVKSLAKKLGYEDFVITNGPDPRGMNVALLYKKSKFVKMIHHSELIINSDYPTRNILEVEFLIDDTYPLYLFVNHWPSLHNPDSTRVLAAEVLKKRWLELLKMNPDLYLIAMGDFNTVDSNSPHPFKDVLYSNHLFSDVSELFIADNKIPILAKNNMPKGTYFFVPEKSWSMLDHFFVNQNLLINKQMKLNVASFEIFAPSFIKKEFYDKRKRIKGRKRENIGPNVYFIPMAFNPDSTKKNKIGFSDHFPIVMKVDLQDKNKKINKENKNQIRNIKN